jgi:hypothetical protein
MTCITPLCCFCPCCPPPCAVPRLPPVPLRHPLADAPSPLVRALPDCEASFQTHLLEARATWEASQTRMHK